MTTHELIELSLLDSLALLDDDEREAFDTAFRAASPAVQAHVRREQTRFAQIDALLPDVTPPAGLRAAVLEAVRRAMAEDDAKAERLVLPPMIQSRKVSRLWRAGALGFATAATVFGATTVWMWSEFSSLQRTIENDTLLAHLSETLGGNFVQDVLFDADTTRVLFQPTDGGRGEASIFANPEWSKAMFFCRGMPATPGTSLKLAIVDGSDRVIKVLAVIPATGTLVPQQLEFVPAANVRLALFSPDDQGGETIISRGQL